MRDDVMLNVRFYRREAYIRHTSRHSGSVCKVKRKPVALSRRLLILISPRNPISDLFVLVRVKEHLYELKAFGRIGMRCGDQLRVHFDLRSKNLNLKSCLENCG
jgi:hypothetical protein